MRSTKKLIFRLNLLRISIVSFNYLALFKKSINPLIPEKIRDNRRYKAIIKVVRTNHGYIKNVLKPYPKNGLFIKTKNLTSFFDVLNKRNIDYVLLNHSYEVLAMPHGNELVLLIRDEHRYRINDLLTYRESHRTTKCTVMTVCGSHKGVFNDLPFFSYALSDYILNSKTQQNNIYVASPFSNFAALAYHNLFHLGASSGLTGFYASESPKDDKNVRVMRELSNNLNIHVDVSSQGIHSFLKENGFLPADDTLTKLVRVRPELTIFQDALYSDIRGGEFMVFVVREKLVKDGLFAELESFLRDRYSFDIIDIKILTDTEKKLYKTEVRGGKWDAGVYRHSGGLPYAVISAFDYYPKPLNSIEIFKQPRMTNQNNLIAKNQFREHGNKVVLFRSHYSGLHSADNEIGAWEYISLLGTDYMEIIKEEVERRRVWRSQGMSGNKKMA